MFRATEQLRSGMLAGAAFQPTEALVDWPKINRQAEAKRREPFNDLAKRLDNLLNASIETSQYIISSNELQAQMASELKSSSDSSAVFAKRNLWLSRLAVVLMLCSLAATVFSIWHATTGSDKQIQFQKSALHSVIAEMHKTDNTNELDKLQRKNAKLQSQLHDLSERIKEIENQSE